MVSAGVEIGVSGSDCAVLYGIGACATARGCGSMEEGTNIADTREDGTK